LLRYRVNCSIIQNTIYNKLYDFVICHTDYEEKKYEIKSNRFPKTKNIDWHHEIYNHLKLIIPVKKNYNVNGLKINIFLKILMKLTKGRICNIP